MVIITIRTSRGYYSKTPAKNIASEKNPPKQQQVLHNLGQENLISQGYK